MLKRQRTKSSHTSGIFCTEYKDSRNKSYIQECDMTPCGPLKFNRRFRGTYHLPHQGRRISRARNRRESKWQAELGLFFDPEDGGDTFLRIVGWFSMDHTALYSRRQYFHNLRCQNLKSYKQLIILGNFLETNFLPFSTSPPHVTTA
jgi:hypothetical protein